MILLRRGTDQVVHESDVPRPRQEVEQEEKNPNDGDKNDDGDDSSDDNQGEEEEEQYFELKVIVTDIFLHTFGRKVIVVLDNMAKK